MTYSSNLRPRLARLLPLVVALGCGQAPEDAEPAASMDPEADRGKADRALYGSCVDACGDHTIEGTCWCDEYCSVYGDCCEDFAAECVTCDGEVSPKDEATCAPVERVGDPIEVCSGSPRFGPPTLAVGATGFAVGCEPRSPWATVGRYAAFFDTDGHLAGEVATRNGPHQRQYRSPLGLYAHGEGYQMLYDYDCASTESLETGHGQSCLELLRFDTSGRESSAPVSFAAPGWNDHPRARLRRDHAARRVVEPAAGFDAYVRARWRWRTEPSGLAGARRDALERPRDENCVGLERGRLRLVPSRPQRPLLRRGLIEGGHHPARDASRCAPATMQTRSTESSRWVFDDGRYVVLSARNSSVWPGTMDRVSLEAIEDGVIVESIEIETSLSRFPTMVRSGDGYYVFTSDGSNLVVTGVDSAFEIDPARSTVLEVPTGFLAGKAVQAPDGDILLAYTTGTWQVSSDNAVYVQRLRLNR